MQRLCSGEVMRADPPLKILCPRCENGLLIVRCTMRKLEISSYYPNGRPLDEIRRYRYCNNCGYSLRTTQGLREGAKEFVRVP